MDFSTDYFNGEIKKNNDQNNSKLIGINENDLIDYQNTNAYY